MTSTAQLALMYQRVVQEELGLIALIDDEGDVIFRHPDLGTMFFSLSEDDPEFLRLVYPGFANANELALTRFELLDVINGVNRRCKSVKLVVGPGTNALAAVRVSASIESFVAGRDTLPTEALLRSIVSRCMAAIRHSADQVIHDVRGLKTTRLTSSV